MESDTNSIGTLSSLKTPNSATSSRKQVNFPRTRPRLVIPPPQDYRAQYTGTSGISGPTPNYVYARKQSMFNFEHLHNIKDFTKSGLGAGEKCYLWLYHKLKAWSRKWFTHIFLTVVLIVYTIGGALIFELVEGQTESAVEVEIRSAREKLLKYLRDSSLNGPREKTLDEWAGEASRKLQDYEREVIEYYHTAHKLVAANRSGKIWSLWNAIVFCSTVYTTIGYGHIYPETKTGKALTIVYAIIGIPLFLIALTDFGKLFTRGIKFLWSFVRRLYYTGSCRRVRKTTHAKEIMKGAQMMYEIATFRRPSMFADPEKPETPSTQIGEDTPTTPAISNFEIDDEFNLPVSLAIFILIVYMFLGGLIYCLWERWPVFDSFYFVFISMSTVGFGDMVPDDAICMIISIVYLVFGLALMSMCINVVQDKLSDSFKQASSKIGATIGIAVDDDGSVTTLPPDKIELPQVHDTKSLTSVTSRETDEKNKDS